MTGNTALFSRVPAVFRDGLTSLLARVQCCIQIQFHSICINFFDDFMIVNQKKQNKTSVKLLF